MSAATYLDASAIVKLVIDEPESASLRRYLRRRRALVSSALARTEVLRAVLHVSPATVTATRVVLNRIDLVRLNNRVLERAGALEPTDLRTLDAIHLATADLIQDELGAIVTYDERLARAARSYGHTVVSP